MEAGEKIFWDTIAQLIEAQYERGHPSTWQKPQIDSFLEDFHAKLLLICKVDLEKAARCGIEPIKGQITQGPTITYWSFRKIFLKGQSGGRATTKEMFALYIGYNSVDDLLKVYPPYPIANGVASPDRGAEGSAPLKREQNNRWRSLFLLLLFLFGAGCWYYVQIPPDLSRQPCLLLRNDHGIAITDVNGHHLFQLIDNSENLTGFALDPHTRWLFWSNTNENYRSIGRVQLTTSLTDIVDSTLNTRFIPLAYPSGISLDTRRQIIYCADYGASALVAYSYDGKKLLMTLPDTLAGRPSALVYSPQEEAIYWTDVDNHWIGKYNLNTGFTDAQWLTDVGQYPDGIALDTLHQELYWASPKSNHLGWTKLDEPKSHLIDLPLSPTAVEVVPQEGILYYSDRNGKFIKSMSLPHGDALFLPKDILTGGASPGAIRYLTSE